jgi:hypothetical protein
VTPAILFVHIGARLPPWLPTAVRQARVFNEGPIYVVASGAALRAWDAGARAVTPVALEELATSAAHAAFSAASRLDRGFRDGFWTTTTERFFVLEEALRALGLGSVVHLESDVMLYADLAALGPKLSRVYAGLGVTFDNDVRGVPGFVFIPNVEALARFTTFVARLFEKLGADAWRDVNDMTLLGRFRTLGRSAVDHLPIVAPGYGAPLRSASGLVARDPGCYSRHADALGYVFDAAALGQYLGGVDPRNGPSGGGFVNESCLFDPRLVRPELRMDGAGRRVPCIWVGDTEHRVANLHVHSKDLQRVASE